MEQGPLNAVLARLAEESVPARVPEDLWRRGRRQRVRRLASGVAGAAMVLLLVASVLASSVLMGRYDLPVAGPDGPRVPATLYESGVLQPFLNESLPGRASAVLLPDRAATNKESNVDWSVATVVGQNGEYRVEWIGNAWPLLSPDGRYLAYVAPSAREWRWEYGGPMTVVDLMGGHIASFNGGELRMLARAWSPDSRHLAVYRAIAGQGYGQVSVLDIVTEELQDVLRVEGDDLISYPRVAFSPDGRRLAIETADALTVVDLANGGQHDLGGLGPRQRLAGPGAWSRDGSRLTVLAYEGCVADCSGAQLNQRAWRVSYVNPDTGVDVDGPALDPVTGMSAQVLAWQNDGDAIVLARQAVDSARLDSEVPGMDDTGWLAGAAEVIGLRPGGGRERVVELPDGAEHVDIAADLLVADRLHGPSPRPRPPRLVAILTILSWAPSVLALMVLAGGLVLAVVWLARQLRRPRRTRPS